MKRIVLRKFMVLFLLVGFVAQMLSISAMATNEEISSNENIENIHEENINVEKEIVSEREECSKVYLLEDGSFCKIITFAPIHERINGELVDIEDESVEENERLIDIQETLQDISIEQYDNIVSDLQNNEQTNILEENNSFSSFTFNAVKADVNSDGIISFGSKGTLVAKLNELNNYYDKNIVIKKASLIIDCECSTSHRDSVINVREMSSGWNALSNLSNYNFNNSKLIDQKTVDDDGTYLWDITDLYTKWDKGEITNNGFILNTTNLMCHLQLTSMCIAIRYREVDENDYESTYHTVNMGRAGTVYINDLTGTVKVEQDIIKVPRIVLPVYLKRVYSLSDALLNVNSTGLRWNYESRIKLVDGLATWKTFDGTVNRFVISEPEEELNGYVKFILINKFGELENEDIVLWVKTTELNNAPNYDYSKFKITVNNINYNFDSEGRIILMHIGNDDSNDLQFYYTNNSLTSVSYSTDEIFTTINFIAVNNNKTRITINSYNDITEETISNELVTIERTYGLNNTIYTVNYGDRKTVSYEFDTNSKITKITDEEGNTLELTYRRGYSDCDGLLSYEKKSSSNELLENLYIDDFDTFRRFFTSDLFDTEEVIQYDKEFNIVSHLDFDGNYTFASYDENGILSSYVISDDNSNELLLCGNFEPDNTTDYWGYDDSGVDWIDNSSNDFTIDGFHGEGTRCFVVESNNVHSINIYQPIDRLEADTTYVFGGWIYVENTLSDKEISMSIDVGENKKYELFFDACDTGYWQYNLMAFKLNEASDEAIFNVDFNDQQGKFYVDDVTLYEASAATTALLDNVDFAQFEVQKNTDGTTNKELISDGITSLVKSYEYDDNQISSITDINGITTYYGYDPNDGTLNKIGSMRDSLGNIINPVQLACTMSNLPTYIEETVTNISTNTTVNMTSSLSYDVDERITQIIHNGVTYDYRYTGEHLTKVMKNNVDMVNFVYSNSNINQITYNNGIRIIYSYNEDSINNIVIKKGTETYKSFNYHYVDNELDYISESVSEIKIKYTDNGFELYSLSNSSTKPVYIYIENLDGSITERIYPDIYSTKLDVFKDKEYVTKTTSKNSKYTDCVTGYTTFSSNQSLNKISNYYSDENYDLSTYSIRKYNVEDYFGRTIETATNFETNINNHNSEVRTRIKVTDNYTYKDLSSTVTTALVTSHASKIDVLNSDNNTNSVVNDKIYYEYDEKGNIVFEYKMIGNETVPLLYYEYDEAGQLVGEYNINKNISAIYTYDSGGNITAKIYHDTSTVVCNNHKVISYGTVVETETFTYDNVSKDLLTNYNGTAIVYDNFGNPLNYCAPTYKAYAKNVPINSEYYEDNYVSGTCEWIGKNLTAFETDTKKYVYDYDSNGYRIKKTILKKEEIIEPVTNEASINYLVEQEYNYIWNDNCLTNIIICTHSEDTNGNPVCDTAQIDIIYNQRGEAVAYYFGSNELSWYFERDINGSVIGIFSETGNRVATINYDAWGRTEICFNKDISIPVERVGYEFIKHIIKFEPICYNGYLFDYETGLYFSKDKVYSPAWGRYLTHIDYEEQKGIPYSTLDLNMYTFCKNNPVNVFDSYSYSASKNIRVFKMSYVGLDIEMNKAFISKIFCNVFANNLVKKYGVWDSNLGYTCCDMNALYIAKCLFARNISKYEPMALNAVNASWGDGWMVSNALNDSVKVYSRDINSSKYEMIWNSADKIFQYV